MCGRCIELLEGYRYKQFCKVYLPFYSSLPALDDQLVDVAILIDRYLLSLKARCRSLSKTGWMVKGRVPVSDCYKPAASPLLPVPLHVRRSPSMVKRSNFRAFP